MSDKKATLDRRKSPMFLAISNDKGTRYLIPPRRAEKYQHPMKSSGHEAQRQAKKKTKENDFVSCAFGYEAINRYEMKI